MKTHVASETRLTNNIWLAAVVLSVMVFFGGATNGFAEGATEVAGNKTSVTAPRPVNINTANAEEIATALNGVGTTKAKAIVAYREQHGAFTNAEQLMNVKGIGESTVTKNKTLIKFK